MSGQIISFPQVSDATYLKCIETITKLAAEYSPSASIDLLGVGVCSFDPEEMYDDPVIESVVQGKSSIIFKGTFKAGSFSFSYYRGGLQRDSESAFFDQISISEKPRNYHPSTDIVQVEDEVVLQWIAVICKQFKVLNPKRAISGKRSKEQVELSAIHEATLTRLETLNEDLIKETQNYRLQLDQEFSSKSNELELKLEREKESLQHEFQSKFNSLENEKNALNELRESIDDKSNTHARRQLRKDIITELKERQTNFTLTERTNKLRRPTSIAMMFLIMVFLSFAIYSFYEFSNSLTSMDEKNFWVGIFRQALYTFGLVGALLVYIRWANKWSELHSQAEFELKKLELDMERASWIVETSLEWKGEKGTEMPEGLMQSLSNNLFMDTDSKKEDLEHPSDQLASALLGASSLVKMKAGGAEIELDPKKLKKKK